MKLHNFFLITWFVFLACSKNEDRSFIKMTSYYKPTLTKNNLEFTEEGEEFLRNIYFFNELKTKTISQEENFEKILLKELYRATCLLESRGNTMVVKFLEKCNTADYIKFLIRIISGEMCSKKSGFFSFSFGNDENHLFKISCYEKFLLQEIKKFLSSNPSTPEFGSHNKFLHNEDKLFLNRVETVGEKYFRCQKFETPQKQTKLTVGILKIKSVCLQGLQSFNRNVTDRNRPYRKSIFSNKSVSNIGRLDSTSRYLNVADKNLSACRNIESIQTERQYTNVNKTTVQKSNSRKKIFGPFANKDKPVILETKEETRKNEASGVSFKDFIKNKLNKKN